MSTAVEPRPNVDSTSESTPRRSRMGAYALWQLRDYLKDRGLPTAIIALLFGYLSLMPLLASSGLNANLSSTSAPEHGAAAELMTRVTTAFIHSFAGTLVFLGALFAMNGIVANDRKLGFYRFLFAKPVSPMRYYGQAFLVHWAGFLGVLTLLGLLYRIVLGPVLTWPLMLVVSVTFLCYAGIAFLLSAAARWDWLSLVAVSVAATFLWGLYGKSTHPAATLLYLLPPLHRTDDLYLYAAGINLAGTSPPPFPSHLLVWFASYGAVSFVLGLIVPRFRRLAIV